MPRITYTDAIARRILDELARGRTLKEICRASGMPNKSSVFAWVERNLDGFGDRYREVRHVPGTLSRYTRPLAERICDELRAGRTLKEICGEDGMPSDRVVRQWMRTDRDGFRARYWQARGIGYLALADEIIDIADNTTNDFMARREHQGPGEAGRRDRESVERSRLRITARCWLLSKMLPRTLGSRLSVEAAQQAGASLREVLKIIDGTTRGLPAADGAAGGQGHRCPACGGLLRPGDAEKGEEGRAAE